MVGNYVDVFSPELSVRREVELPAGTCCVFKQFDPEAEPAVIHSTCRLVEQSFENDILRFTICGPQETRFIARISLGGYTCAKKTDSASEEDGTLKITGSNSPDGITIELKLIGKEEPCCV